MIKFIIFDFDDTLSDFQLAKEKAKEKITPYIEDNGIDTADYWAEYEDLFEKLFARYINHELEVHEYRIMRFLHHGITEEQAEHYNSIYLKTVNKAILYDDVIPVITELKSRGYKIFILSNGPESQRKKISECEAGRLFDRIFISAELGVGKPDTAAYDKVLNSVNAKCNECLMVGDSYEND